VPVLIAGYDQEVVHAVLRYHLKLQFH